MITFANVSSEAMQALCTPMHSIIAASPQQHRGALYLGSFTAILDPHLLTSHNIEAVVQVLESPYLPSVEAHAAQGNKLDCWRIDIHDSTNTDLRPHLESTVRWIDEKLKQGINVLVHCQQGISRSASVVIAYLIYTHKMSYDHAFDFVKSKRACIKPNSGFVQCLQDWEKQWQLAPQARPKLRRASITTAFPLVCDHAFDFVKSERACTKPNSGFVQCLQEWEKQSQLAPQARPKLRRASITTAFPLGGVSRLSQPCLC